MSKLTNIGLAVLYCLIAVSASLFLLEEYYGVPDLVLYPNYVAGWKELVGACVLAPVTEEIFFRWAPFQFIRGSKDFEKYKWPLIVVTSFIFGFIHGNIINVYIQGVLGIFFAWVYLKNNFSLISSITAHAIWNFLILWLLPKLAYGL